MYELVTLDQSNLPGAYDRGDSTVRDSSNQLMSIHDLLPTIP